MRIESYLDITPEEITSRAHNIWLGISLGNKYFTKENIEKYIKWSIDNTKEKVLVVIADMLHAINLEVLDGRTPEKALKKAIRIGDKKAKEITEIISGLSEPDREKVIVVRWKDILKNDIYKHNSSCVYSEFSTNKSFHDLIVNIVKIGREDRMEKILKMTDVEMNRFCEYVLNELPHFINGVEIDNSDQVFTVIPYPGLSRLNELSVGLNNKTMFLELSSKLKITNHTGIVEAYVE